jgi:hypothetical protein
LGIALVAGKKRVPSPATGNTALRTGLNFMQSPQSRAQRARLPPAAPVTGTKVASLRAAACLLAQRGLIDHAVTAIGYQSHCHPVTCRRAAAPTASCQFPRQTGQTD